MAMQAKGVQARLSGSSPAKASSDESWVLSAKPLAKTAHGLGTNLAMDFRGSSWSLWSVLLPVAGGLWGAVSRLPPQLWESRRAHVHTCTKNIKLQRNGDRGDGPRETGQ